MVSFSADTLISLCSSSSVSGEVCVLKKRKWQRKAPWSRSIQPGLTPSMSNIKLLFFLTAHITAVSHATRLELCLRNQPKGSRRRIVHGSHASLTQLTTAFPQRVWKSFNGGTGRQDVDVELNDVIPLQLFWSKHQG